MRELVNILFGYSRQMEIILSVISLASTLLLGFLTMKLVLILYDENEIPLKKQFTSVAVISFLYYCLIYGTYALYGFKSIPPGLLNILTLPNPIMGTVMYLLGVMFLKITPSRAANITRQCYIYMFIVASINLLIDKLLFSQGQINEHGYNYLLDAISVIVCDGVFLLGYYINKRLVRKYKVVSRISEAIQVKNFGSSIFNSVVYIICIYIFVIFVMTSYGNYNYPKNLIVITVLVILLDADINFSFDRLYTNEVAVKSSYINSLAKSIEGFTEYAGFVNETLDKYDVLIKDEDWQQLRGYHEKLIGNTRSGTNKINLSSKMSLNPALISLLLKKLDYAEVNNVQLIFPDLVSFEELYISDIDLSRVLGNLIDNAIEAASESEARRVSFSVKEKVDECKLIIISNSIKESVDIDSVSVKGVTTKAGHSGVGLTQVRNILRQYNNSSIHFSCFKKEFTVFIEIWKSE